MKCFKRKHPKLWVCIVEYLFHSLFLTLIPINPPMAPRIVLIIMDNSKIIYAATTVLAPVIIPILIDVKFMIVVIVSKPIINIKVIIKPPITPENIPTIAPSFKSILS